MSTATAVRRGYPAVRSITILNNTFRLVWMIAVTVTISAEVIPAHFAPAIFYTYEATKCFLFLTLGYLTPLAFWRYTTLNRAFLFAAASASAVELLQNIVGNGHKFSFRELFAKVVLIAIGFLLSLNACDERAIRVGPLRIQLLSEHLPER